LKGLSYLIDIPIEKKHSDYSGTLEVSLHRGEWKLSTFNAIYSFGKHYTSFKIAFDDLQIQELPLRKVLILGVGLGSIARLLDRHPTLKFISAVDIDPAIIDLAKKYWPISQDKIQTTFHAEDGIHYLQHSNEQFDLILSDIFIDDQTPDNMLTSNYLHLLKTHLSENGMLIYSKLHYTEAQKEANITFDKKFQSVFSNGFTLLAQYNKMYIHRQ
jgi:spermidine synthase